MLRLATIALAAVLVIPSMAGAQDDWAQVVNEWASAPDDPQELASLLVRTRRIAGPEILRAVLDAAVDPDGHTAVRLHAMAALLTYVAPGRDRYALEILLNTSDYRTGRGSHPDYTASSSIEPILRDSVRVVVQGVEADEDPTIRLAARNLSETIGPVLRERLRLASCESPHMGAAWLGPCIERITDQWTAPLSDSLTPVNLLRGSQELRDERLPPVLDAVALDPSRTIMIRWAALQVLATLAHPRMYALTSRPLRKFDSGSCIHWGWWHAHHAVQEEGLAPLGPEGRVVVLGLLRDQAARNPDEQLRMGALDLAECVEHLSKKHPTPRR